MAQGDIFKLPKPALHNTTLFPVESGGTVHAQVKFPTWLRDCNIQNSQTLLDFGFEWSFPNFSPLVINHGFTFKSLEEFLNNIGAQSGPGI